MKTNQINVNDDRSKPRFVCATGSALIRRRVTQVGKVRIASLAILGITLGQVNSVSPDLQHRACQIYNDAPHLQLSQRRVALVDGERTLPLSIVHEVTVKRVPTRREGGPLWTQR